MIEVEVKAWVKDEKKLDEIVERISHMSVLKREECVQRDIYFSHPSRNFLLTDEALRLRIEDGKCELTYKGPKIDPISKTRVEITVKVDSCEKTIELLRRLGFSDVMEVFKERRIFVLLYGGRTVRLSLDRVKDLGTFVELECETERETEIEQARNLLFSLLEHLGIPREHTERRSYLELLLLKRGMLTRTQTH